MNVKIRTAQVKQSRGGYTNADKRCDALDLNMTKKMERNRHT